MAYIKTVKFIRLSRLIFVLFCSLFVLSTVGCSSFSTPASNQADASETASEPLSILHPRSPATPPLAETAAVYLTVINNSTTDRRLLRATSEIANRVELHESRMENNIMRMVHHPDGFVIPAATELHLEPGGKHVMLIGLTKPLLVDESYEIRLDFDDGFSEVVRVSVIPLADSSQ